MKKTAIRHGSDLCVITETRMEKKRFSVPERFQKNRSGGAGGNAAAKTFRSSRLALGRGFGPQRSSR
jgi:hypothetical protein